MPQLGICRLCGVEKPLIKSHFMPKALYPKNPVLVTERTSLPTLEQMKEYLLCRPCDNRFNDKGESEVVRWLAPKTRKRFPLLEKMKVALCRFSGPRFSGYSGTDIGVNTDHFAHFALSILWRAGVREWIMPTGDRTRRIDLSTF